MADKIYYGQKSFSEDSAEYNSEDNTWKVLRRIKQSVSEDLKNWVTRSYAVMVTDKSIEFAHKKALESILARLSPVDFNLFEINITENTDITEEIETPLLT
jgi:hypothetical protein